MSLMQNGGCTMAVAQCLAVKRKSIERPAVLVAVFINQDSKHCYEGDMGKSNRLKNYKMHPMRFIFIY
jgi:hypothetical protein